VYHVVFVCVIESCRVNSPTGNRKRVIRLYQVGCQRRPQDTLSRGSVVMRLSRALALISRDPVYRERCAGQRSVNPSLLQTRTPITDFSSLSSEWLSDRSTTLVSLSPGISCPYFFIVPGGVLAVISGFENLTCFLAVRINIVYNAPQRR
jgi:hypothetical protein